MKKRIICVLISIFLLLTAIIMRFSQYYAIAADNYALQSIKAIITNDINQLFSKKLTNSNLTYKNITNITYTNNGQIASIVIDTAQINFIANSLSEEIYNLIENSKYSFGIPIGNALGSRLFSGCGPQIGVNIQPLGATNYNINSELIEGGINQTLHRIVIDFKTEIICLCPFYKTNIEISTPLIIAETLIVGKVPEIMLSPNGS